MTSFCLADLVAPQSINNFIHATYAQSWIYHEGEQHRFRGLADWGTLNTLLATQRFESPRLRVVRRGEIISVETYTEQVRTTDGTLYRRIVVDRLLHELRKGATLTLNRIEEAHEPVRELTVTLESELKAQVSVHIFASWMPVPAFDLHWDEQDIFVIQLEGRKRWQIFGPTRQRPLHRDVVENPKPETLPVAEFDVSPGGVLYLPHGWWHSVSALEGPSLHLTVSVVPDSGIDFLTWLVGRARLHELFRRRLPRFADGRQQQDYLASVRASWNDLMAPEDILDQFLAYADGTSRSLPLFGLPDMLSANSVLGKKSAQIVLLASRATVVRADDGFVLTALGRRWSFSSATRPLINAVLSQNHVTVEQVIELNVDVSEEQSVRVIFTLLRAGVVALQ